MAAFVPKDINVHHVHDVNINLHISDGANAVGKSLESIIWTFCLASIIRSRLKK